MGATRALQESAPPADAVGAARAAGLRYVHDDRPGIRRLRSGKAFRYVGPDGHAVRDADTLKRIRSLVIPPAWTDVWICPLPNGHIQASGRDARGRKQYRYHPRWREVRDETKYHRMVAFGLALPGVRGRVEADLALPGLPRRRVLAAVVRLLETTLIRVGNEEYARANGSFGLTTLHNHHAEVNGATVRFRFHGKSGVRHAVDVSDRRLARLIRQCQDLPGHELFEYVDDDGRVRAISSADVNEYLREASGDEFTAKDYRTWGGTVLAAEALRACGPCDRLTRRKKNVVAAVEAAARRLGNTVAVCRKCYVHPAVVEAYLDGSLAASLRPAKRKGLAPEEAAVLAFLQARLVVA